MCLAPRPRGTPSLRSQYSLVNQPTKSPGGVRELLLEALGREELRVDAGLQGVQHLPQQAEDRRAPVLRDLMSVRCSSLKFGTSGDAKRRMLIPFSNVLSTVFDTVMQTEQAPLAFTHLVCGCDVKGIRKYISRTYDASCKESYEEVAVTVRTTTRRSTTILRLGPPLNLRGEAPLSLLWVEGDEGGQPYLLASKREDGSARPISELADQEPCQDLAQLMPTVRPRSDKRWRRGGEHEGHPRRPQRSHQLHLPLEGPAIGRRNSYHEAIRSTRSCFPLCTHHVRNPDSLTPSMNHVFQRCHFSTCTASTPRHHESLGVAVVARRFLAEVQRHLQPFVRIRCRFLLAVPTPGRLVTWSHGCCHHATTGPAYP